MPSSKLPLWCSVVPRLAQASAKFGLQLDGAAIGGDRLVEAPQGMQRVAEIAVRLGEIRIGGDRLALRAARRPS